MICPHCNVHICLDLKIVPLALIPDPDRKCQVEFCTKWQVCPNCTKFIAFLSAHRLKANERASERMIYPPNAQRTLPPEVVEPHRSDFSEAVAVLPLSANASAAISRRCLQNILREKAGVTIGDLSREIEQVLKAGTLPQALAENLDAVRHIGNLAAHPVKDQHTGEVVSVEPGEAEWNIEVLEGLFDFYFVQPEKNRARKAALNAKPTGAGKKPIP